MPNFPVPSRYGEAFAAVFKHVDYWETTSDGLWIVVIDTIGGKTRTTKRIARFLSEIEIRHLETKECA